MKVGPGDDAAPEHPVAGRDPAPDRRVARGRVERPHDARRARPMRLDREKQP